jgi:hypothetical protein
MAKIRDIRDNDGTVARRRVEMQHVGPWLGNGGDARASLYIILAT